LQGALPAPAATWNLNTKQPRYFAPTWSDVVNLNGLLKTKDKRIVWKMIFFAVSK
jgi:hypothetical protein